MCFEYTQRNDYIFMLSQNQYKEAYVGYINLGVKCIYMGHFYIERIIASYEANFPSFV